MELKAAIERAVRFCPRVKSAPVTLKAVRLVPAYGDFPPRIYSTAGHLGVLVDVECSLPNALIPAEALRKIVKEAKSVDAIEEEKLGVFRFRVTAKGSGEEMTYSVNGGDLDNFPGYPGIPLDSKFSPVPQWSQVLKVLHAVGKEAHKPDLQTVRFHPEYVVATDDNRTVRVDVAGEWSGFVPADVFRSWPRGVEVSTFWDTNHAFFRVGEEVRFAAVQPPSQVHDRRAEAVRQPAPYSVVVDTVQFGEVVRRALDVSPWKLVALDLGPTAMTVRGFHKNREVEAEAAFEAQVDYVRRDGGQNVELLVNAKYLAEELKVIDTPRVLFRYEAANKPIQLQSGWVSIELWPSPWKKPEKNDAS